MVKKTLQAGILAGIAGAIVGPLVWKYKMFQGDGNFEEEVEEVEQQWVSKWVDVPDTENEVEAEPA